MSKGIVQCWSLNHGWAVNREDLNQLQNLETNNFTGKKARNSRRKKNESVTYLMLGQRSFFSYGLYLEAFWQSLWPLQILMAMVHRRSWDRLLVQIEKFPILSEPRKVCFRIVICMLLHRCSKYLLRCCMICEVLQEQHSMHSRQYHWDVDLQ